MSKPPSLCGPTSGRPVGPSASFVPVGNWTRLATSGPPSRANASMAWDPNVSAVVLFGGSSASNVALDDTWEFAHSNWTQYVVDTNFSSNPPGRWGGGLVYDGIDGYALLFGGRTGTIDLGDTWEFTPDGWSYLFEPSSPSPRAFFNLVYDAKDQYVLLYGGTSSSGASLHDTWKFSGGVWTNLTGSVHGSPPTREFGGAAYDAADGYAVFFGGRAPTGCSGYGLTYTYSGGTWSNVSSLQTEVPSASAGTEAMTYDTYLRQVVLFSGYANHGGSCAVDNETWVLAGGTWQNLTPRVVAPPMGRCCGPMAFDPQIPGDLLFGGAGNASSGGTLLDGDTWSYAVAPLTLRASANRTEGAVPFYVAFQADARGGFPPYQYAWSFTDGAANASSPTVDRRFTNATTVTATVNVTDSYGLSVVGTVVVHALPPLLAGAAASPDLGPIPLSVLFHADPTGGQGPYTYLWRFGDASAESTLASPEHTYHQQGPYTAQLTLTDSVGDQNLSRLPIEALLPLAVAVTASPSPAPVDSPVSFRATGTGGSAPYVIGWDFGDGSAPAAGSATVHVYTFPGRFSVSVNITDALGETNTTGLQVIAVVAPLGVVANATSVRGDAPLRINFSGAGYGGVVPYRYVWSFGDGSAMIARENVTHVYLSAGSFAAVVQITDAGGRTTRGTIEVLVASSLQVSLTTSSGPVVVAVGHSFTLAATVTGGTAPFDFRWSGLPDGCAMGVGPVANCTARSSGAWRTWVDVHDAVGSVANATVDVSIQPASSSGLSLLGSSPGTTTEILVAVVGLGAALTAVYIHQRRRRGSGPARRIPDAPEPDGVSTFEEVA